MTESLGTAALYVTVDTEGMAAGVAKAKASIAGLSTDAQAQFERMSKAQQRAALSAVQFGENLGKTRAEIRALAAEQKIGGALGKEIAASIRAADAAQAGFAASTGRSAKELNKFGLSAKQQAAALRGLPAQLTDIATGLASGQRPLTVLLQQGGQLKDMFGGIVPAARAMAGAVVGLINPLTIAAAASGALFLAWKQGDDEGVALRQSLALTGNAAGVTADQMQAMALAISQGVPTQHAAAEALAEVAKTGKFTGEQLREVAEAALAMEAATGQAISKTVAEFAKMRGDPLKAVTELNEQYHFLTISTFEQIKALQAQGREEDALNVAIAAASKALKSRADDVVANAGYMERAWKGLGAVVRQVWDDMRNAGRASSVVTDSQLKIESARSGLSAIARNLKGQIARGQVISEADLAANKRAIATFKRQIAEAQKAIADDPSAKAAAKEGARQRANDLAVSLRAQADTYLDGAEKLKALRVKKEGEIAAAVAAARKAGDDKALQSAQESGKKILAAIDKQIADASSRTARASSGGGGRSTASRAAVVRPLPEINTEAAQAELDRLAEREARATESFRDMEAQLQGPLAVAMRDHAKRVEELNALAAQSPEASARLSAALELEAKRHADVVKEIEAQQNPMSGLLADMEFELSLIGKSNAERAVMIELRRQNIDAMSAEGQAAIEAAKTFEKEAEAKQRSIDLMDEFRSGASNALTDIVTGAKSAKEAFADFFDDLARRITQMIAERWIEKAFGAQGSDGSGTSGGGWIAAIAGLFANANGNAFQNGNVMAFANGGVFDKPTMFGMGGGRLGVMGEAGPEAILPLHRGPDGKLGVRMAANDGGPIGPAVVHQTVVVQGVMDSRTPDQLAQATARAQNRASSRNR